MPVDANMIVEVSNPGPMTAKGTPIVQPNVVPAGYYFYGSGAYDDIAGGTRGDGNQLAKEVTGPDVTQTFEGRFLEHVYIIGGYLAAEGAGFEDHISLTMFAPASAPTSTPGTGNANKVATGLGFNIIVPAVNGDWTVDGSTLEAGEINQSLCPVPNTTGTGYWNWDPTASPSITPASGDGAYDLFDVELPLARQANRYPLIAQGHVTPEAAVKGKKVLPHWIWRFSVYRKETGSVKVAVRLDTARLKTT
jgi:hypothetical protein